MARYDYLIAGAGLFGSVFAHEAARRGKRCLVVDRRAHIGGNVYTEAVEGIQVHRYGAHIFHTANRAVWEYVNRFADFRPYVHQPVAVYGGKEYPLPFNMNTFRAMWGEISPDRAREIIARQVAEAGVTEPRNLEEQAISMVGRELYQTLVEGYTEKQWGRPCRELPTFIIRRLPVRFIDDNNYFNDPWQGIPAGGYTGLVARLLEGVEVRTGTDYLDLVRAQPDIAARHVFTGTIDEFFDRRLGPLEYRSLRFETELLDRADYQGCAVVNHTDRAVPYTRIIEHKHFEPGNQAQTVISREYSLPWEPGREPYYPVNDEANNALYRRYEELAKTRPDVLFGGRLGSYRYYDMDKVIEAALAAVEREF